MPFIRHSELNCAFFPFKDNAKILKHALLISIFSEWRLENPLLAMAKPKLWLPGANPNPNPNPRTSTSQMDSSPTCPDLGFYILSDSCCGRRCLGVSFSGQEPREG